MKWIDKWLANRVRRAVEYQNENYPMESKSATMGRGSGISTGRTPQSDGMKFTLYPANGGHVLEYSQYNKQTDQHTTSLHLITADQNMGDVIGQAITLEMLKR